MCRSVLGGRNEDQDPNPYVFQAFVEVVFDQDGTSASIGLVPRQSSSGGKDRLGGIGKRGDRYLRSLFTTGARSVAATLSHDRPTPGFFFVAAQR